MATDCSGGVFSAWADMAAVSRLAAMTFMVFMRQLLRKVKGFGWRKSSLTPFEGQKCFRKGQALVEALLRNPVGVGTSLCARHESFVAATGYRSYLLSELWG